VRGERINNTSQQLNARTWWRGSHAQAWAQLLFADIETPGAIQYPSPGATYQNINPSLALQTKSKMIQTSTWINFQQQNTALPTYAMSSTNRWMTVGTRLQSPWSITSSIRAEPLIEYTAEKLWHDETKAAPHDFKTPTRQTVGFALGVFMNPTENFLIHPHLRAEYVSDLKAEQSSIHPGIGLKWDPLSELNVRSNFAWISRAPNFSEMYFDSPPFAISNRQLKRQRSLQYDIGYEWSGFRAFKIQQTVFADRTERIIKTYQTAGVYQSKNRGTAYGLGLENEITFTPHKDFEIRADYTTQYTSLGDHTQPFKPAHSAHSAFIFFPHSDLSVDLPIYFRTSAKDNDDFATTFGPQLDLGAHIGAAIAKWRIDLRIWNLLGWHRIEKGGYPLAAEPYAKLTVAYDF
jgi:outer membrane receptor protein involved in Fe transport